MGKSPNSTVLWFSTTGGGTVEWASVLPREAVESPSSKTLRSRQDMVLGSWLQVVGPADHLQGPSQPQPFCDAVEADSCFGLVTAHSPSPLPWGGETGRQLRGTGDDQGRGTNPLWGHRLFLWKGQKGLKEGSLSS